MPLENTADFGSCWLLLRHRVFTRSGAIADQHHRNEKLITHPYQYVATLREAQAIGMTSFSDRHFWQQGYDKALT
jgi:hypothetical protein